jgi:hypothetical protein
LGGQTAGNELLMLLGHFLSASTAPLKSGYLCVNCGDGMMLFSRDRHEVRLSHYVVQISARIRVHFFRFFLNKTHADDST